MRTIGMDHARQARTSKQGFRVALHESALFVVGALLVVGGLAIPSLSSALEPYAVGPLSPGVLGLLAGLLSLVLRLALSRRKSAQSGGANLSTRSSSPGAKSSPGGKG